MNKVTYATRVLQKLRIPVSTGALKSLVGWMDAEGGHTNGARYNYLNTTQSEPGAGNTGTQGNIKVYRDWEQGIDATVTTLKNGSYGSILGALRRGDSDAAAHAIASSRWGTGALVLKTIPGAKIGPIDTRGAAGAQPSIRTGAGTSPGVSSPTGGTTTQTRTIPGQSLAPERGAAAMQFLSNGRNDSSNNLDFAMQIRGLQDVPGRTVTSQVPGQQQPASTPQTQAGGLDYTARANALDAQHLPYQWGGGHGSTHVNPYHAQPVDCSGAVSAVLGIDPRVSGQFEKFGKPGRSPSGGVTIYANGHHVIMEIGNKFFGTSGTNAGGGAGWIDRSAISPQYLRGFTARHI